MDTWLEVAHQLPFGHKKRIRHDCSESRDLLVSHGENGYSAYCFRCGNVGFEGFGYRNLAELERIKQLNDTVEVHTRELPEDFTLHIPDVHTTWLSSAGISAVRAQRLGIGWSDKLQRVVLPIYDGFGKILYWQARAVREGHKPKYSNPAVSKSDLLYWQSPNESKDLVVVTEDILSAIRIGKHVCAASILGTKTSDSQASQLSAFKEVVYWLDPDDAGYEGARVGCRKLGLVTRTREIRSEADPKNLSDGRIRELLGLPANERYAIC